MAEQVCPACACTVLTDEAYEYNGILYCCEACAKGGECECGCCKVVEQKPED